MWVGRFPSWMSRVRSPSPAPFHLLSPKAGSNLQCPIYLPYLICLPLRTVTMRPSFGSARFPGLPPLQQAAPAGAARVDSQSATCSSLVSPYLFPDAERSFGFSLAFPLSPSVGEKWRKLLKCYDMLTTPGVRGEWNRTRIF